MSKQKQKGTLFETLVSRFLAEKLGVPIERRTLGGANDKGDIAGVRLRDGTELVIECKNHRTYLLKTWADEAQKEAANAGGIGAVVFHANGVGAAHMENQYVLMRLGDFVELINAN